MRDPRGERGVAALMTVGFLAVVGGIVIALMLASARTNDSYTLLYSAAQSAAYSAATAAEVKDGEVGIPCESRLTEPPAGCDAGLAVSAAYQFLKVVFRSQPGGFCLAGYNCDRGGGRPVYMRVEGGDSKPSLKIFNTDFNPGSSTKCYDQVLGGDTSRTPIPPGVDGVEDSSSPPGKFICWGLREELGKSEPSMHSIQYSSGVIVRLETTVDLFAFRDRQTAVQAAAAVSQGE